MKENREKRRYLPPGLTVVAFAAERGFAASQFTAVIPEFLLSEPTQANSASVGESRDEAWLF